jgi:hypothetical protein
MTLDLHYASLCKMWDLRFLTAVTVKVNVVWDVIQCGLVPCVHLCYTKLCHDPEYIDIFWEKFQSFVLWGNIPLLKIKITKGSLQEGTGGKGKGAEHTGLILCHSTCAVGFLIWICPSSVSHYTLGSCWLSAKSQTSSSRYSKHHSSTVYHNGIFHRMYPYSDTDLPEKDKALMYIKLGRYKPVRNTWHRIFFPELTRKVIYT